MKKSKFPFISVVVPMFNAEKFILPAIKSVLKTSYPNLEIIIVDDLSNDKSYALVLKHYSGNSKIRIFKNEKRMLAAGSRNRGVSEAKGEYIALLDHDIQVDKNWLIQALKVFKKHPQAGCVQGVVLDITRKHIIQHAGIMINAYLGWVISLGFGQDIRKYRLTEKEVFADATGLIFKKEVWRKIGGFDESLAINVDDWDFNWRMWVYGYKQYLAPGSITYHWSKKQKTRDAWIKRTNWEFHFAKVPWLFLKNYETINVIKFLPVYLAVGLLRGLFNIFFRFNPAVFIGFVKAVSWIILNLGDLIQKREVVQANRRISDAYLLNNVMDKKFVFDYFKKIWIPIIKLGREMSSEKPY